MIPGYHVAISARAWVCCSACCAVAGVVGQDLGGGLGISACARGAYLGTVSPVSLFGTPFAHTHGFPPRDGTVERDDLCARVCHLSLYFLLVVSVVDAVVARPSLSVCVVRVSAGVLVVVARVATHLLFPLHRSEDSTSLPVSFPKGMVLCMPGRELRISPRHFRRSLDVMLCPWCCMGRKSCPLRRAGRISDADGYCFCLTADAPSSSICVPVLAV